jgi:hypothetical protein
LSEPAGVARADLYHPDLRVGVPGEEAVRGGELVAVQLVVAAPGVDEDKLPLVVRTELRTDPGLIDLVASTGDLLSFAVRSGYRCHATLSSP